MASKHDNIVAPALTNQCNKCGSKFPTKERLDQHQKAKGHSACPNCGASFYAKQPVHTHGPQLQDLICPGCDAKFASGADWMVHVENGACPRVFPSDLAGGLDKVLKMKEESISKLKAGEYEILNENTPSHIKNVWGDEWADEKSPTFDVQGHQNDFPRTAMQKFRHGDIAQQDFLTGDGIDNLAQDQDNAWGQQKKLFATEAYKEAYKTVPPPAEDLAQPASASNPTTGRIIDPNHPSFNAALFVDPILDTYKCPHNSCKSKFKTSTGLISHLKSPAHYDIKFNCPGCRAPFVSQSAWIRHAETIGEARCRIRKLHSYGLMIQQITNGALVIDPASQLLNGVAKLKFDEEWAKSKRPSKLHTVPGTDGRKSAYYTDKDEEATKKPSRRRRRGKGRGENRPDDSQAGSSPQQESSS
ncbi:hypothetical protein GGS23DRAFT_612348 [Durotheca rogersii]|uniref:uncharacterized protein n=1 Tax=Durotheca rogersii TaxID=419775 RepID=UPI002220BC5A|nr:uncharacterized protein GGS23DRAFT_612348 [Durotheca rogersii]KAI5867238.1 hypothetical protein GGS23DRAFT_612348 [Durotheca rogersii]